MTNDELLTWAESRFYDPVASVADKAMLGSIIAGSIQTKAIERIANCIEHVQKMIDEEYEKEKSLT